MQRIPPSQRIRQQIQDLLKQGLTGEADLTSTLLQLGMERLVQEIVEQEVSDYLGREHYQRRQAGQEPRGYRNGYEPGRIRTAEGEVAVQVPQVRDTAAPYRSRLISFWQQHTEVLEQLTVEMYARGLSTRDIEDTLRAATGERLLSRTAVSQVTAVLWEEYQAFWQRDLADFAVEYLFLDAVYESLRQQGGGKEGVLCAWAICADGRKVMLHLALGNKEAYETWLDFLRDLVGRGLRAPVLVTTDGAPGLLRAMTEVFPHSLRQRCLAHQTRNLLDQVPANARAEVKAAIQAAYYAPNPEVAEMMASQVLKTYQDTYPTAMTSFQADWKACIAYLVCRRFIISASGPPTCWSAVFWNSSAGPKSSPVSLTSGAV